jgi:hypothetical protein
MEKFIIFVTWVEKEQKYNKLILYKKKILFICRVKGKFFKNGGKYSK